MASTRPAQEKTDRRGGDWGPLSEGLDQGTMLHTQGQTGVSQLGDAASQGQGEWPQPLC